MGVNVRHHRMRRETCGGWCSLSALSGFVGFASSAIVGGERVGGRTLEHVLRVVYAAKNLGS
jgi:hypothetical protein